MNRILFGLVIQGPVSSFGNGPNNSKDGFLTEEVICHNVQAFAPYVDSIVISTWENSGLKEKLFSCQVKIIENKSVLGFDFLNQRKQFVTTYSGIEWLKEYTDCTHVLKIRTDQLVPPELISWLKDFYEKSHFKEINQEDFLIFSEALKFESFYAGDFIFAGTINDLGQFCKAVLTTKGLIHPMNGSDYVLKWLQSVDEKFLLGRSPLVRSLLTARNSLYIQSLWHEVLNRRLSLIPKEIYKKILWRGKAMSKVIPSIDTTFFFYEDIASRSVSSHEVHSAWKTYKLMREYWNRYLRAMCDFKRLEDK